MAALVVAHADAPLPPALADAIIARSEGNPFFAEELLAAAGDLNNALPTRPRDPLLQRGPARPSDAEPAAPGRGRRTRRRAPAVAGTAQLPERTVRDSLRQAVEHGVLVADQAGGIFRFRHALWLRRSTRRSSQVSTKTCTLASPTSSPGGAARSGACPALGPPDEPQKRSSPRSKRRQAEAASVSPRRSLISSGRSRSSPLCRTAERAGLDLVELCTWTAELASEIGLAARAVELGRRAIELVGNDDPHRAALLHVRLGEYP